MPSKGVSQASELGGAFIFGEVAAKEKGGCDQLHMGGDSSDRAKLVGTDLRWGGKEVSRRCRGDRERDSFVVEGL